MVGVRARSGVSSRRKIEPLLTLLSTTLGASAKQKGLESRVRPGLEKAPLMVPRCGHRWGQAMGVKRTALGKKVNLDSDVEQVSAQRLQVR